MASSFEERLLKLKEQEDKQKQNALKYQMAMQGNPQALAGMFVGQNLLKPIVGNAVSKFGNYINQKWFPIKGKDTGGGSSDTGVKAQIDQTVNPEIFEKVTGYAENPTQNADSSSFFEFMKNKGIFGW